ncbi:MAG TPA: DNA internalization-related competence protein ComEC/Rec2, partial [Methylophilaceae bacterium]|nr:DNA internalization-related competence protein ComEC/Rec2 [Methylophilaceae bacterium]
MQALGLMFVAGVWMLQQMPSLPGSGWLLPLAVVALILWLRRQRTDSLQRLGWLVLATGAGFMWAACAAHLRLADALPSAWEGRDIEVIGVVATLPQHNERGQRFEFDVEQVLTAGAIVPEHISVSWYRPGFAHADAQTRIEGRARAPQAHAGERWQLTVRLKRPHGNLNPHGFDLEAWLLERDIRATGYVREDDGNRLLQSLVLRPAYAAEAIRERIRTRMTAALEGRNYAGILQALAIGDEGAIEQAQWEVFRRTGTSHLMSISGLHITMLAGLVFGLIYHLWRRSQRLTLRLPARKAATAAGLMTALLYAVVAGFSVPTQRTLYMLAVFAAALWFGRNLAVTRVLTYALVLVALLDPWAVLAPGFWLSFGAVAVIAFAAAGRLQSSHWLRAAASTQWAVSLGLVPLLLVLFQQVSLVSPLANALAIPLVSFVVVPLTLLGTALPFDSLLHLAHWWMSVCMQFLQWLALLPVSTWQQQAPPVWTLPLAVIGILWLLLPRGFPLRWLGLTGLLPMLLLQSQLPAPGAMEVAVLDVGQGLAVVVRTAQHALLYDVGPRYSAQTDSGNRIVLPYLRASGITRL